MKRKIRCMDANEWIFHNCSCHWTRTGTSKRNLCLSKDMKELWKSISPGRTYAIVFKQYCKHYNNVPVLKSKGLVNLQAIGIARLCDDRVAVLSPDLRDLEPSVALKTVVVLSRRVVYLYIYQDYTLYARLDCLVT